MDAGVACDTSQDTGIFFFYFSGGVSRGLFCVSHALMDSAGVSREIMVDVKHDVITSWFLLFLVVTFVVDLYDLVSGYGVEGRQVFSDKCCWR